ncbi:glycosyltransferase [Glycomyces sp. A-F 0318]|uniref:HAD hydrolase-like protein n=1 Tax=Glycomyces amatae TaxID=2881355 RepID=UPI001E50AD6A|nr:HAD hydrolase-like protein [Glycomyces amatae]MCD0444064.1 glycosyltransferase [Glycomyces amatae]
MSTAAPNATVVIPVTGGLRLRTLLLALAAADGPAPERLIVVDDRPRPGHLDLPPLPFPHEVLRSHGKGPGAARNLGWRAAETEWVAFLDEDAIPSRSWFADLAADLAGLGPRDAASRGRTAPSRAIGRRPAAEERAVELHEGARWDTGDLAVRRDALQAVGGFDERFRRPFREHVDLCLRLADAGWHVEEGARSCEHPARPRPFLATVRDQAGNTDNALMRAKHGLDWRDRSGEEPSPFGHHLATTALGAAALYGTIRRQRWGKAAASAWVARTGHLVAERAESGTASPVELADMALSSVLIPPVALFWNVAGTVRHRRVRRPEAVLFVRDGTLIAAGDGQADVGVTPMPGAEAAIARLRAAGVPFGLVAPCNGARPGPDGTDEVERRVSELLGPFGTLRTGADTADPNAGIGTATDADTAAEAELVTEAAADLGARPKRSVLIGHTGADVEAALAAGARAILVPTEQTEPAAIAAARRRASVARDLCEAVDLALDGR